MRSHRRAQSRNTNRSTPARPAALVSALAVTGLLVAGSSSAGSEPAPPPTRSTASPEFTALQRDLRAKPSGPALVPAVVPTLRPHPAAQEPSTQPDDAPPVQPVAATPADAATPAPGSAAAAIPEPVLAAYRNAELILRQTQPGCGLTWNVLAGIGRIESGHARSGNVDAHGRTVSPILGPALDGTLPGNEIIRATSGYVRAIGPMQFLPSTWQRWASDGNGDGITDPNNIYDAALAAGRYLCADGANLSDPQQRLNAVLRYNHSMAYASNVLTWSRIYAGTQAGPADVVPSVPETSTVGPDDGAAASPDEHVQAVVTSNPKPGNAFPTPAPMIYIPGLPPIPCGILCPPPPSGR
ncbi:lytic transglycosylase domain-containing protein [Nocardia miyunensis]|uniref:lytic transglycosylase domain-containing protein n=1 Tax=Nocardia miyunensis TaxID=282684 RepID=UPI000830AD00|nr:lytic murein transglycosylase [Nocardia miyunensis]